MARSVKCYHCGHVNVFEDHWAGKVMRCKKCGGIVTVPKGDDGVVENTPAKVSSLSLEESARLAQEKRVVEDVGPRRASRGTGLPIFMGIFNGVLTLAAGCAAGYLAAMIAMGKIKADSMVPPMPPEVEAIAFGAAGVGVIWGGFYLLCAAKMGKHLQDYARAGGLAAIIQLAVHVAVLIYGTFTGLAAMPTVVVEVVWLLLLCGFVDFNFRVARDE